MRSKLFLAFIIIIFFAVLSNVVFERLVISDFNDYLSGIEEDHVYWIMASVEGSSVDGEWDMPVLEEALHWGLMLGFETYVEDMEGGRILSSTEVLSAKNESMRTRMHTLLELPYGTGGFSWYPLYVEGKEIGKLYVRPLEKLGPSKVKENIFRKRGREFLIISFLIGGAGALLLSILFTMFISNPIRRLTCSAEKIATGDFSVQSPVRATRLKDEVDRLTESFNFMAEALRREDALRKHLTSNVAHELRTPLTVIKGNLEGIEDGVISDPDRVMKNISSEIERIISLVEGIEDITSAEASFFRKGVREEIDLNDFVESVGSGMRPLAEEKGLYLKTEGPAIKVRTYPEKLHIILKNLISNACKFTNEGGVTVTWGGTGGLGFYISVSDTGKGIPQGERGRVFERFYKEAASGGKGLGLAIVEELAGIMGGRVDLESAQGAGARFTVTFGPG